MFNNQRILVCKGVGTSDEIKLIAISKEELSVIDEDLKDYLICVEGSEESSYDNSDDDRAGCYSSSSKFKYHCEIDPKENTEHLIVIDGKVKGVVFYLSKGYNDYEYYHFLFDGSIQQSFRMGYSASHSSDFCYVNKVTLVKRGENGVPCEGKKIYFRHGRMDTSVLY